MNELQGDLNRLEIAEKLSRMEAYEENPFKFKPIGVFSPKLRPQVSGTKEEEEEELKKVKAQLVAETSKYRDLLKKKHAADAENLKHYLSVQRSKGKYTSLQAECRALQAKNKEREKSGKESVEAIKLKTSELKESVTKSVESISATIEKDEKTLLEKEREWSELADSLLKTRKHRELQLKQKEAVQNATKLQAQIGDAKGAQRAHAMTQLKGKRELQLQRLAEKEAKHREYEQLLLSLSERNETVKSHLAENVPVYEGYLEKEALLRKQLELLQKREATALAAVHMAEQRAIQSALEPDQVAKVRALNASKARECKSLRDRIKGSHLVSRVTAAGGGSDEKENHAGIVPTDAPSSSSSSSAPSSSSRISSSGSGKI